MNIINKQRETRHRLGELFLETGIVDHTTVSEGLSIAKRTSFPIGRVLVMTGWVDDHDINCALEIQNLLRDGTIDRPLAKDLLRFSHLNKVDINEAFRLNWLSRDNERSHSRLGKLILASGVADENQMAQAMREAVRHDMPLGSALLMLRIISPKTFDGALNLQIMMRDKKVTFAEAIQYLKEMPDRSVSLREVLGDHGKFLRQNSMVPRIGEMLISAQIVSARDVLVSCEIGTESDESIGRVMLGRGHVSEHMLESALKLQHMIANRVITYRRAVKILKLAAQLGASVEKIMDESAMLDQVFTLLRRTKVIPEILLREVASQIVDFEETVAEAMLAKGYVNPIHARIGLACLERIRKGELTEAKAAFIMHHCFKYIGNELEMFTRVNWSELGGIDIQEDLLSLEVR